MKVASESVACHRSQAAVEEAAPAGPLSDLVGKDRVAIRSLQNCSCCPQAQQGREKTMQRSRSLRQSWAGPGPLLLTSKPGARQVSDAFFPGYWGEGCYISQDVTIVTCFFLPTTRCQYVTPLPQHSSQPHYRPGTQGPRGKPFEDCPHPH